LHPDVVEAYEYIFIWDEDLDVEHFNAEKYVCFKHIIPESELSELVLYMYILNDRQMVYNSFYEVCTLQ
jgi:hypothetical protein